MATKTEAAVALYQGLNGEQKIEAVAAATTVKDLDVMAGAWQERGHSPEGVLMGRVLARKIEIGYKASDDELAFLERIAGAVRRGKALPPITGKRGK